ncbi:transglycosylase SLT domain-containing protein, partial [Acidimicrobiaceae bacterium USS-CC1]|nr:transglycosylase SLT domain-containing protein [Acidiferrimicrobium australe]
TVPAAASALPTYVVQPGDSFWGIAQEDGLTVGRLAAANGLAPSDVLLPGEVLRIPPQGSGGSSTGSVPSSPLAPVVVTVAAVGPRAGGAACPRVAGNAYGVLPAVLAASPERQALLPLFRQWAAVYGVSPALVEAIAWQESGWQAGVVSPAGAVGIGQLLPATVRFIEANLVGATLDPWSANDNIRMMTAFVAYLAAREGGDPCATIAAYYEGPGALASVGLLPVSVPYIADVEALVPQFE